MFLRSRIPQICELILKNMIYMNYCFNHAKYIKFQQICILLLVTSSPPAILPLCQNSPQSSVLYLFFLLFLASQKFNLNRICHQSLLFLPLPSNLDLSFLLDQPVSVLQHFPF